ncbi:MAG: Protein-L-isoaspartate O-methyltransferase (EC [uncultured Thiotrichaceae bacterium]|uniref:Protein-L-isoaspartate O-methyltransferase n=1 Tax=uncultured Thiotrichaceae bacterium TaxID=298394 RepID=A0A6S6RYW8_9GAMM|nr:MAG: Protein-L-isoaspartate O-methyltransferase (EC [uncultured Thiotrichaceae bacterium]
MNLEQARFNMIEQQVRPWDVLDPTVLDVMRRVPREAFVDSQKIKLAYADIELPIGHGESMMHPRVEGRMLQSLNITPDDHCLEVGTGSGYIAACLGYLGAQVHSIDIHQDFIELAEQRINKQYLANVKVEVCDVFNELADDAQYDVIAVTGAIAGSTEQVEKHLKPNGRMFVITGVAPVMQAMLIVRGEENTFSRASLFETKLHYLTGAEPGQTFSL